MPTFYIRASLTDEATVKVEAPDADTARLAAADWFIDEVRGAKTYLTDIDTEDLDPEDLKFDGGEPGAAIVARTRPDSKPGDYHGYDFAPDEGERNAEDDYDDEGEDVEDPLTDEERERRDILNLAMERNPDIAFTASDMEDF